MNWIKIKDRKPNDSRIHIGMGRDKEISFFKMISDTPLIVYTPGIGRKKNYDEIIEWLDLLED